MAARLLAAGPFAGGVQPHGGTRRALREARRPHRRFAARRGAEGGRHHRHDRRRRVLARHVAGRERRAGRRQLAATRSPSSVRRCRMTGCWSSREQVRAARIPLRGCARHRTARCRRGRHADAAGRSRRRRSRRRATDLHVARHARAALRRRRPGHGLQTHGQSAWARCRSRRRRKASCSRNARGSTCKLVADAVGERPGGEPAGGAQRAALRRRRSRQRT